MAHLKTLSKIAEKMSKNAEKMSKIKVGMIERTLYAHIMEENTVIYSIVVEKMEVISYTLYKIFLFEILERKNSH